MRENGPDGKESFIAGRPALAEVARMIVGIPLQQGFRREIAAVFLGAFLLFLLLGTAVTWLFIRGIGIWGVNIPVAWGIAIANFVWWIGIGHAGTFISAFLLLLHQEWRASVNRFAETVTLFAVICAGLFPLLHLGRPQFFYWLVPYPNTMALWPQFRSPLIWDFFAVFTYFTVSLLFWYTGLIPDLAAARDLAAKRWVKRLYGLACLGWRGAGRHWQRHQKIYLLMAGLATPLVISVHTVVSFDFASAIVPGWHSTIFPPYFVAGALYSGFAMVLTLMLPIRRLYRLETIITPAHLDRIAKLTLTTGLIVAYGYLMETFITWYSGSVPEWYHTRNQLLGPYGFIFLVVLACNVGAVQVLWAPRARRSPLVLFILSVIINIGMWSERFMIVIVSLHRGYMPSRWALYYPTAWDWATLLGSMGLFLVGFLIFFRVFPLIASFEVEKLAAAKTEAEQ
jgi:molybdopterin-containing oxidoreductase family membrane subunit